VTRPYSYADNGKNAGVLENDVGGVEEKDGIGPARDIMAGLAPA